MVEETVKGWIGGLFVQKKSASELQSEFKYECFKASNQLDRMIKNITLEIEKNRKILKSEVENGKPLTKSISNTVIYDRKILDSYNNTKSRLTLISRQIDQARLTDLLASQITNATNLFLKMSQRIDVDQMSDMLSKLEFSMGDLGKVNNMMSGKIDTINIQGINSNEIDAQNDEDENLLREELANEINREQGKEKIKREAKREYQLDLVLMDELSARKDKLQQELQQEKKIPVSTIDAKKEIRSQPGYIPSRSHESPSSVKNPLDSIPIKNGNLTLEERLANLKK